MDTFTEEEGTLLDKIGSERVTTTGIVARWAGCSEEAARKRLSRLKEKGWLRSHIATKGLRYFSLSQPAARQFKLHRVYARPLGYLALVKALTSAYWCSATGARKLSVDAVRNEIPELYCDALENCNYAIDDDTGRVSYVLVDMGSDARGLKKRAVNIIAGRMRLDGFKKLDTQRLFRLVIATPTEGKRRKIEKQLAKKFDWPHVTTVVCVPEILSLI